MHHSKCDIFFGMQKEKEMKQKGKEKKKGTEKNHPFNNKNTQQICYMAKRLLFIFNSTTIWQSDEVLEYCE